MEEIFKDIPGYEGLYQVSNLGRVKSLKCGKEKLLKNSINFQGYYRVGLSKDRKLFTKKIHQLVAIAFLNHIPCKYKIIVDHINNNPLDNRLENLQLITVRENTSKDRKDGSSKYIGVSFQKERKKWMATISVNRKNINLGRFNTEIEAHNAYQNKLKETL